MWCLMGWWGFKLLLFCRVMVVYDSSLPSGALYYVQPVAFAILASCNVLFCVA